MADNHNIFGTLKPEKFSQLVGDITILMAASNIHRAFPITDLMDIVLPPVNLNQFRIYHDKNKKPVGLVTWGFFSPNVLARYVSGDVVLTLDEWKNGDQLVFTDMIAPFGHAAIIVKDLRTNIFPESSAYSIRFDSIGKPRKKIRLWRGATATKSRH